MTPVAGLILVGPGIEVKTVEGDALHANSYRLNSRTDIAVEPVLVHPEILGRIAEAYESRQVHGTGRHLCRSGKRMSWFVHLLPRGRLEHGRCGLEHGALHSKGRQGCCGVPFAQRRELLLEGTRGFKKETSRVSQSTMSDRNQPTFRPRYWRFCGNRRRSVKPVITSLGRRVRRATSWALRRS
jgi:hypothetical protein